MKNLFLSFTFISGLILAGCGSSVPDSTSVTCELNAGMAGHECIESTGPGVSSTCPGGKTVTSCPSDGSVGTCVTSTSILGITESESTTYYTDGMYTADSAKMACDSAKGTWTAK